MVLRRFLSFITQIEKLYFTDIHISHMVFHMKTTLNISETTMTQLKQEAARLDCTMSELVECALRNQLRPKPKSVDISELPVFQTGGSRVNVANREALYEVMGR